MTMELAETKPSLRRIAYPHITWRIHRVDYDVFFYRFYRAWDMDWFALHLSRGGRP